MKQQSPRTKARLTITSRSAFVDQLNEGRALPGTVDIPMNCIELRERHAVSRHYSTGLATQSSGWFNTTGKVIAYNWHHFRSLNATIQDNPGLVSNFRLHWSWACECR
jgi:hypothetical protein